MTAGPEDAQCEDQSINHPEPVASGSGVVLEGELLSGAFQFLLEDADLGGHGRNVRTVWIR